MFGALWVSNGGGVALVRARPAKVGFCGGGWTRYYLQDFCRRRFCGTGGASGDGLRVLYCCMEYV